MRPYLIGLAALLATLAIASQLALPPLMESETEKRIQRFGGDVTVELSAFPALRLLFEDGERIEIRGGGQRFEIEDQPTDAFDHLDGFDEVRMRLTDVEAGPLVIESFSLNRAEDAKDYTLRLTGETTPSELAGYIGRRAGGALGGALGDAFGGVLPGGDTSLPVQVRAQISSKDGRAEALGASGSVAGIPAGPLAELVADAVVRQL